ncbi:MAG: hypothetical protein ACP5N3_04910 [Candidatus Nanoarchaeia archaeon]
MIKNVLSEHKWLNDIGGASNWMGNYCADYLSENPDLPETDCKVIALKKLTPRQELSIDAFLETQVESNRLAAGVYKGWAYAEGALRAFREKDYSCALIYYFLGSKEIESALRKDSRIF